MVAVWYDLRRRMAELVADWRPPPRVQRLLDRLPPLPIMLPWLNLVGSAFLGLLVLGVWGLVAGPVVFLTWWILTAVRQWIGPVLWVAPPTTHAATPDLPESKSVAIPLALAAAPAPAAGRPASAAATPPQAQGGGASRVSIFRRVFGGIGSLFSERMLPFTMLNLGMLAVLCTLIIGVDFAFWLALGAVPIILIGLMLMSLDGQEEAEDSLEEEDA